MISPRVPSIRGLVASIALLVVIGCSAAGGSGTRPIAAVPGSGTVALATSTHDPPGKAPSPERTSRAAPWIGASPSSDYLLADLRDQLVGVWVDVPAIEPRGRAPASVVVAVDTSASMEGEPIARAREAVRGLVASLADGDVVSILAFSDEVTEVVRPTEVDVVARALVERAVGRLEAKGSTNLHAGLALAQKRAAGAPHSIRRVVLISDGKVTVGPSSVEVFGALAEAGAREGVQVTAIGVGLDYDEHVLDTLAMRSSGRLHHLADAKDLPRILESELGVLSSTIATHAVLEIAPAEAVSIVGVEGAHAEAADGLVRVRLGTLHPGQRRDLAMRVRFDRGNTGQRPIASVRLTFVDALDPSSALRQEVVVSGELGLDQGRFARSANARPQSILAMLRVADLAQSAAESVSAGQLDGAVESLDVAWSEIEDALGRVSEEEERERLVAAQERVGRARKAVRAKAESPAPSPAASRADSLELNDAAMHFRGL